MYSHTEALKSEKRDSQITQTNNCWQGEVGSAAKCGKRSTPGLNLTLWLIQSSPASCLISSTSSHGLHNNND